MNSFISNSIFYIENESKKILDSSNLNHPDYFELTTLEDKSTIGINEVKNFTTKAYIKPFIAKNKVFVIKNAELMTIEAQNSMLKLIEEPPLDTYIFFQADNFSKLLLTIRSRCSIVFIDNENIYLNSKLPNLESILKMKYEERYQIIKDISDDKLIQNKSYISELIDKFIFESQNLNSFVKIVSLCIESKKYISNNVTPKNVLELLFLKLPRWSDLESN